MNGSKDMAWKLTLDLHQFLAGPGGKKGVKMVVCPPFPYLVAAHDFLSRHDSALDLGGQDCSANESGAFTGDISPLMLKDAGCGYVILGHSERRQHHAETDAQIGKKILAAQKSGLMAVLCVGETKNQRESGQALAVLSQQLKDCLATGVDFNRLIVAYEPVWAIGTGLNASVEDIKNAHAHIRAELSAIGGDSGGLAAILYGGSVKAANAAETLSTPGVDGVLVGGASLNADEFSRIYACA